MNRNILKYIAIIAMTLNHIGTYLVTNPIIYIIFKTIGRITFPIMCFFIVQGFIHTSNKAKYGLRLFLFALIAQIPWVLLNNHTLLTFKFFTNLNTIFTLLIGYLFLFVLTSKNRYYIKTFMFIPLFLLSLLCDYKFIVFLYMIFFYYFKKEYYKYTLPVLFLIINFINIIMIFFNKNSSPIALLTNLGLFITIPFLLIYNGKSGNKNLVNKYFFYLYYPIHLLIIYGITFLI